MSLKTLIRTEDLFPARLSDLFKPFNGWFDDGSLAKAFNVPAVNVTENEKGYQLSFAAPGLKKEDFKIDIEGNTLTVSSEKEEKKEEKDERYMRKEYGYSSFSRSFTLPEDVSQDKVDATYNDGILNISLPKTEITKTNHTKSVKVK